MPNTLPPVTLTLGQVSPITIPGDLGAVSWVKLVNASPYLLQLNNLTGGSDYMMPGEANVWNVPGLSTAIRALPLQFGVPPSTVPSSVMVATWYLENEPAPRGNYPVNFNALSYIGNAVTTNASTPNSLEQDVAVPCVISGLVATPDGTTLNRLDVASGVALLRQSDNSLGRVAPSATNFTTVQINSTYYLFLNNDGTWTFQLSATPPANSLQICSVTTDGSGNISAVTDTRQTIVSLFPNANTVGVPALNWGAGVAGHLALLAYSTVNHEIEYWTPQAGATALGHLFITWNGAAMQEPFAIGNTGVGAATRMSDLGAFTQLVNQPAAGSFGVPVIVAQALGVGVTVTTQQTILSYTPSVSGWYRISATIKMQNTNANPVLTLNAGYSSPDGGLAQNATFIAGAPGGLTSAVALSGVAMSWPGGSSVLDISCDSVLIHASNSGAINIRYTDATATPNDTVSCIIERLA